MFQRFITDVDWRFSSYYVTLVLGLMGVDPLETAWLWIRLTTNYRFPRLVVVFEMGFWCV